MAEKINFEEYIDPLREVGSMGAGKASVALSSLINKRVNLSIPKIYLTETENVSNLIAGSQQLVVGCYSAIKGDVSGTLLVIMPIQSSKLFVDLLEAKNLGTTENIDIAAQSKLKEASDILSKNYLESITSFLGLNVLRTPERIVSTFGESLADLVLLGIKEKYALLLSTEFDIPEQKINGKFIMLLAVENLDKVINGIKKQLGM